jgi:ABC-type phosphate/phosphonate transport system substrate-binding protein
MKKIFATLAVAAAMFAFVSCQSPAEKAKKYKADIEAAVKAGNVEEADKLAKEAAEWEKSLTDAERVEVAKALGEELGF